MNTTDSILSDPILNIGDTPITLGTLLIAGIIVITTLFIASLAKKTVQRFLNKFSEKEAGTVRILGITVQIIIWIIGFEIALHLLGIHLTSLFAASGFLALGAGFAIKNIVENFLSGGILRLEHTIRPGDLVVVDGKWIYIHHIGMRVTTAKTYSGEEILIPNSLIAQAMVENLTRHDNLYRIQVQVGVAYESDLDMVRKTIEEMVERLEWRSRTKEFELYLDDFGDSSVNYSIDVWIDDVHESRQRKSDLHEAVWWALKDKGIAIAYPQLDVHLDKKATGAQKKPG